MSLDAALDDYAENVNTWLEATKKEIAAVAKLQKAVLSGNVRDLEKLRQSARNAAAVATQRAADCVPLTFDAATHLRNGYLDELEDAARKSNVKLYERDGVLFCYPSLVRLEPELMAVRIDKKLEANIRPSVLVAQLKKAQSTEPKSKPERFIEALANAYLLLRARKNLENYIDLPLSEVHDLLTLLPGLVKEYSLLDFTRDLYFLDISGVVETKNGLRMSLPASTVSRERSVKILPFVTRDGHEKQYAAIRFTPPQT